MSKSHVNADEVDLVARAREGDQAAFAELVRRLEPAVYRAALAASGSAADADDIAQETFLLVFRRLKSFRGDSAFKTWVLSITWHQAMNHRRRMSRWWKHVVSAESDEGTAYESVHFASTGGTPEDLLAQTQLRGAVRDAIRALPAKLRDPLLLVASGEYSYDEVGAMLKAPAGTIKWRVSEARRQVKERLAPRHE